jgi:hypothetical protein
MKTSHSKFDKKRFDQIWLTEQSGRCFTCHQIDDFVEYVGKLCNDGMNEEDARKLAYEVLFV